jgi:hypothetical protein
MSDFDIDSSIANLERKLGGSSSSSAPSAQVSTGGFSSSSGGKLNTVKYGVIAALLSGAMLYFFRPMWLYSIKFDEKTEKCKPRIRLMKAVLAFIVLTVVFFVAGKRFL